MMGSVRALRCLMAAVQVNLTDSRFVFNDDQLLFSTLFVYMHNSSLPPLMTLDYRHRVFAPLWDIDQHPTMDYKPNDWASSAGRGVLTNRLTGGTPFVFHANGNQPRSFLDQHLVPLILQRAQQHDGQQQSRRGAQPSRREGGLLPLTEVLRKHAALVVLLCCLVVIAAEGVKASVSRQAALAGSKCSSKCRDV